MKSKIQSCPLCHNRTSICVEKFYNENYKQEYLICHCNRCGIDFSTPFIAATSKHYQEVEWYGKRWEFEKLFQVLPKSQQQRKVLEIGCGEGYFLDTAIKNDCLVTGLDFNKTAIEIAKKRLGTHSIYALELEDYISNKLDQKKFDMIAFFHVLEHLERPFEFLIQIKNILEDDGFVTFSVPSWKRDNLLIRKREKWDYPPHHLTRWYEESIYYIVNKAGFEIVNMSYQPLTLKQRYKLLKRNLFQIKSFKDFINASGQAFLVIIKKKGISK
jgi:2-polyprenyl-3-methyl-5-hydroxy-6-metoxy-1,4-benzoquinol methylase